MTQAYLPPIDSRPRAQLLRLLTRSGGHFILPEDGIRDPENLDVDQYDVNRRTQRHTHHRLEDVLDYHRDINSRCHEQYGKHEDGYGVQDLG